MLRSATTLVAFPFLAAALPAQQFVRNTAYAPASTGATQQVDFADVDNDGDWDAAFANGGDTGNQQSQLWINQGGLQGGTLGEFADETAARLPALPRASRDIEFVDYDGDGDVDIYLANDSSLTNQDSRLWTNMGGAQGGTLGYYGDESFWRWYLDAPGTSIPPGQLVTNGGFVEHANDADFADIDYDGDMDMVQATWGPSSSGLSPTRVFLNVAGGRLREFNPSGFQMTGATLADGDPGLWCEGLQASDTTDATGAACDVATTALNADWGDVDNDFDLDLILGARFEMPRLYRNWASDTSALAFRDVSGAWFEPGHASGAGHDEECFADFDDDDDLDIYGVNWRNTGSFEDGLARNDGNGVYGQYQTVPASGADDSNADPVDYDNDGDLDVVVANVSGQERVVQNDGSWGFSATSGILPVDTTLTLDTDSADIDGDGDMDILCANSQNESEWYLENTTSADDTTAPRIGRLAQLPDKEPGTHPTVARLQVYDNTSLMTSQSHSGFVIYSNQTGVYLETPIRSSGGQVFRAEIDGTLTGLIGYRAVAIDEHGNFGISPWKYYAAGMTGTAFCAGDGTATACPCDNVSALGRGCGNSLGAGARLVGSGNASVANDTFELAAEGLPNTFCLFFQGESQVAGGMGAPFGDGLRCVGGPIWRLGTKMAVENVARYPLPGDAAISVNGHVPVTGGVRHYQIWYRNGADYCTPATFNLTNGWTVSWAP